MSEISLILVLYIKTNKTLNDMAKIQIKSKKLAPFGGILSFMELFNALLDQTIDFTLGLQTSVSSLQNMLLLILRRCSLLRMVAISSLRWTARLSA